MHSSSSASGGGAQRDFVLSLPLTRDGSFRGEFNIQNAVGLSLDWQEWGMGEAREEAPRSELKEHPGNSLKTRGRQIGATVSRYTNPTRLSGFHWGLGAALRQEKVNWIKDSETLGLSAVLDESEKVHHNLEISGPAVEGRVGYRYIGETVGFMAGIYLNVQHFQPTISDMKDSGDAYSSPIDKADRAALERRITTRGGVGLEIGWAF